MVRVIGLASESNKDTTNRKARFFREWQRAWPGLKIEPQISVLNHPSLRGYGLFVAYYSCLYEAWHENDIYDYLIIFEDDAIPFDGTTWPSRSTNDLDSRLDDFE